MSRAADGETSARQEYSGTASDPVLAELSEALAPRIQVIERIGIGGMGTVYLGRDPVLRRSVAIKLLSGRRASESEARDLFLREAQATAAIDHPSVVRVYEVGQLPRSGIPYFVMQYVDGGSIAAPNGKHRMRTGVELRRTIGEVAGALAAAHAAGLVHRDIKPENVMIERSSGRAIVVDFGISAAGVGLHDTPASTKVSDEYVGTPAYTSPEQAAGKRIDEKSDVYSLGVVGFELSTGRLPFEDSSPLGILEAHINAEPPRVETLRADLDAELSTIINGCLRKDPAARPSAGSIAQRLAPTAGVLLEWPPPGLEQLPEMMQQHMMVLRIAAIILGLPALIVATQGDDSALRPFLPTGLSLAAVAFLGLIAVVGAFAGSLHLLWVAARNVRHGYPIGTIVEVLADRRGDTGALIAGSREYGTLSPADRALLRRRRVQARLAEVGFVISPALAPLIGIGVAKRAGWSDNSAWVVGLGVIALMLLLVLSLQRPERLLLRDARNARRRLLSATTSDRALIDAWRRAFERARVGQMLGLAWTNRGVRVAAAVLAAAIITVWAGMGVFALTVFAAGQSVIASVIMPKFANTEERYNLVKPYRRFALPPDTSITLERANEAFNNVSSASNASTSRLLRPPTIQFDAATYSDGSTDTAVFPSASIDSAFFLALKGLTQQQREFLQRTANVPTRAEFELLERAPALDADGAVVASPLPPTATWWELPIPRFATVRGTAYAEVAQAVLDLEAGRPADAERRLRGVMRVGYLLADGRNLITNLIGTVLVQIGRRGLANFFLATGRTEEAAQLTVQTGGPDSTSVGRNAAVNAESQERLMELTLRDPTALRGLRFEMLANLQVTQCGRPHDLIFGSRAFEARMDSAAVRLIRFPADSEVIAIIRRPLTSASLGETGIAPSIPSRMAAFIGRQVDRVVGGHRFETCAFILELMAGTM